MISEQNLQTESSKIPITESDGAPYKPPKQHRGGYFYEQFR